MTKAPVKETPAADTLGLRFDANKPRYDLIPPTVLHALAIHYAKGSEKYDERNWEKGLSWCTTYRALQSHANTWFMGQTFDDDPSMSDYRAHHMISVIWNAIAIYEYERRGIGTDDRPSAQFSLPFEDFAP